MSIFNVSQSGTVFLHNLTMTNKVTSKLASMAAGRVIAQYAPLPSPQVESYTAFFLNQAEELDSLLGNIHAVSPVDYKAIKDYAIKFYNIRCENALGCCQPSQTGKCGLINLFHAGVHLSGEELELISENSMEFTGYVCGFEAIYKHHHGL